MEAMNETVRTAAKDYVHFECRRSITKKSLSTVILEHKRSEESNPGVIPSGTTTRSRSNLARFNITEHCLFCGYDLSRQPRHHSNQHEVMTLELELELNQMMKVRQDKWAVEVQQRIASAQGYDLVANEAKYHQSCRVDFMTVYVNQPGDKRTRESPILGDPSPKRGRKASDERLLAFLFALSELENSETGIMKVRDMIDLMVQKTSDPYSYRHTTELLKEQYSDRVKVDAGIVTCNDRTASIFRDFLDKSQEGSGVREMVKATARILSEEIRNCSGFSRSDPFYPDLTKLDPKSMLDDIPDLLRLFYEELVCTHVKRDQKIVSFAHCLMQANRPGTLLMPLPLASGLLLRHHFSSRYLSDVASSLGWCLSYTTLLDYEKVAAITQTEELSRQLEGAFMQYAGDNFDHNLNSLDGSGTVHIMGLIGIETPGQRRSFGTARLKKQKVTSKELSALSTDIDYCSISKSRHFYKVKFESVVCQSDEPLMEHWTWIDHVYVASRAIGLHDMLWRGTMQAIHKGDHSGVSSVHFLPMIDLDPTDMNCIYTTLKFIQRQCEKQNCTPVITFDQPLYLKAFSIIHAENSDVGNIYVRLGKFHLMLCWLSVIGTLYSNSGLNTILEQCYVPLTVDSIMKGKAFSRGMRAHSLAHSAIYRQLLDGLEEDLADEEKSLLNMFHDLTTTDLPRLEAAEKIERIKESQIDKKIAEYIRTRKEELQNSPTAQLWFQYLELVELLFGLYRGERLGDIDLTTAVCQKMLDYLAAG